MMTEDQLSALIRRHRELGGEVAEIQAEMTSIKEQIEGDTEVGWKLTVDGITASKRAPNRNFDLVSAVALLPAEMKMACVTTSYDAKKVRAAVEALGLIDSVMVDRDDAPAVVKL